MVKLEQAELEPERRASALVAEQAGVALAERQAEEIKCELS